LKARRHAAGADGEAAGFGGFNCLRMNAGAGHDERKKQNKGRSSHSQTLGSRTAAARTWMMPILKRDGRENIPAMGLL
jgi:hypothetical protein